MSYWSPSTVEVTRATYFPSGAPASGTRASFAWNGAHPPRPSSNVGLAVMFPSGIVEDAVADEESPPSSPLPPSNTTASTITATSATAPPRMTPSRRRGADEPGGGESGGGASGGPVAPGGGVPPGGGV